MARRDIEQRVHRMVEELVRGSELELVEVPLDGLGDNTDFFNLLKTAGRLETIHTQETTLENIFIEVTGQELTA